MSSKKRNMGTTTDSLPALRIGSRVRCTDDGVEGRITWANGVAVKIQWDDGEQVTWRRDSLAGRPIEILDRATEEEAMDAKETPPAGEPSVSDNAPSEGVPPQTPAAGEERTELLPQVGEATADATEPVPAEPASSVGGDEKAQTSTASSDTAVETAVASKRRRKVTAAPKQKKTSALDAAAQVLVEAGQPMSCQELIVAMSTKGYWTSPGGKTPAATLYSAILREITTKGANSRFVKAERGKFALVNEQ